MSASRRLIVAAALLSAIGPIGIQAHEGPELGTVVPGDAPPRMKIEFDIDELFSKFSIPEPHATPIDRIKALYESDKTSSPTKEDLVGIWMGHGLFTKGTGLSVQNFILFAHDHYRVKENVEVSDFMVWAGQYRGDTRDGASAIGPDLYRRLSCIAESFGTRHSNRVLSKGIEFTTETDLSDDDYAQQVSTVLKLGDYLIMKETMVYVIGGAPQPAETTAYAVFFKRSPIQRKIVCGGAPSVEL